MRIDTSLPAGFIGPSWDTVGDCFPIVCLTMDCDGVDEEKIFASSPWPTDDALGHDKFKRMKNNRKYEGFRLTEGFEERTLKSLHHPAK